METDETEAFEAALSFVDEFSLEDAAEAEDLLPLPSQIQDDLLSTNSSHAEEKRRRQREINEKRRLLRKTGVYGDSNRVRNERTREIAFLRGQIEKLQLDLQVLQRRQTSESAKDKKTNASALITTDWDSMHIWKEQAVRQRRRREEAESDNAQLRLAAERQRKVASSLQSLMKKRASQLVNECASLVNTSCPTQNAVDVLAFRGDIGDFHDLFCHLDSAYRNVDAVFAANELTNMAVAPDDVHVCEGVEGKYLKFFTYKDLPFGFQDTTEAVWDHFKGVEKHMGYGSLYQKMAKNLDEPYTIIEDFSKEVYSNNSRADVDVKQVVRRYVEADRDMVIWVSHATPAQVKHELLQGLSYNFRGYSITRRSPASTPDNELTQIQLCSLISLDQEEETKYGPDNVRALTNFLIVHAAKNILSHRERIENTLADRALRRTE